MSAALLAGTVAAAAALLALGLAAGFGAVTLAGACPTCHRGPPPPSIAASPIAYRTNGPQGTVWENGTAVSVNSPVRVVFDVGGAYRTVIVSLASCSGAVSCYSASLGWTFVANSPTQVNATVWGTGTYTKGTVSSSTPAVTVTALSSGGTGPGPSPCSSACTPQVLPAFNWATSNLTLHVFDQSTVYNASLGPVTWSFGDWITETGTSEIDTYSRAGIYNVTETVTASSSTGSAKGSVSQNISVALGTGGGGSGVGPAPSFASSSPTDALIIGPAAYLLSLAAPFVRSFPPAGAAVLGAATAGSYLGIRFLTGS